MTIAGQTFTVNQAANSCYGSTFSPTISSFNASGGTGSVGVTAPSVCSWTATSNASWITITAGSTGTGNGTVSYSVSGSPGVIRDGTITFSNVGLPFTVHQEWYTCSNTISPTSKSFIDTGGTGSVDVTANHSICPWTASSNASWITITAGSTGNDNGTVSYSVSANTGASDRSGTMTIAGKTFTVTQAAVGCSYSISPTSSTFTSSGGAGSVVLTNPYGCPWDISSNAGWIQINWPIVDGLLSYSVLANTGESDRSGMMTIGGQTFTVTQSGVGCSGSISPTYNIVSPGGTTGSVGVTAPSGCLWTATSNADWITITGGGSGTGNGTVSYSVSANTGASDRSGTMTIAGKTFNITQSGQGVTCTYLYSPPSNSFTSSGGAGSVSVAVSAPGQCGWSAESTQNWMVITGGGSGTGNGTVSYSVSANTSQSTPRSGYIMFTAITQALVTINQTGCSYSTSSNVNFFTDTGGMGSVGVTNPSGCSWSWTASSDVDWITITAGGSGNGNGTVSYSVSTNTDASIRSGKITIAGQEYFVTQSGDQTPPTGVSAGANQTKNATFTQIGTATDAVSYLWTQQSGPGTITFGTPEALSTTISASADGTYVIRFTATDTTGNSTFSDMTLIWDTTPPTGVSAGNNVTTNTLFTQTGIATDLTFMTYSWTKQSGPGTITFGTSTALSTTVLASVDGTYILRFTTTDAAGNSSSSEMTLVWDTTPPTGVSAGNNVTTNSLFTQTGIATDLTFMTYSWTKQSGPGTITFGTPTALSTTVSASADGTYILRFTATDAAGNSSYSEMTLVWDNTPPTDVSAGVNQTKNALFTQTGTATDAMTYVWTKQSGPGTITFGTSTALSTTVSASADGSYILRFAATDAAGNTSYSNMTLVWDTLAPTVSIGSPSTTMTKFGPVTYTVTYTGADTIILADANVTLNKTGTANGTATVSGTGNVTRTVTISGITGDGTLGISIAAGTASDSAGNLAAASGPSSTFTVDNTAPVTTASPVSGVIGKGQAITLTPSEAATIYYTLDNSVPTTGSTVYDGPLYLSVDGTVRFFARDLAGNLEESIRSATYRIVWPGDVNFSNDVDLADAILAMQILSGMTPAGIVYNEADVNADGKIGMEEAIYILQTLVGLRSTQPPPPAGMVLVPAGSFQMGDAIDGMSESMPVHPVTVSAFYLDQYEVTKALWDEGYTWATAHGYSFDYAGEGTAANHPVHTISWYDAVKWLNARSEKEGRQPVYYTDSGQTTVYRTGQVDVAAGAVKWSSNGYRLPTEAEWEYAARAGTTTRFFTGSCISTDQANYDGNYPESGCPAGQFRGGTTAMGSFAPNLWGLYDMAGNVWEWTWDWYDAYPSSAMTNPRGPDSAWGRVVRGGCWLFNAGKLRSAFRSYNSPSFRGSSTGFRSARSQL